MIYICYIDIDYLLALLVDMVIYKCVTSPYTVHALLVDMVTFMKSRESGHHQGHY